MEKISKSEIDMYHTDLDLIGSKIPGFSILHQIEILETFIQRRIADNLSRIADELVKMNVREEKINKSR